MPLNLRYDLQFRFDRTLARRLQAAWKRVDECRSGAVNPTWWDRFHANRMRRGYVRHRIAYKLKARLHVAFTHVGAIASSVPGSDPIALAIFTPFYFLAWLIAPRPFPRPVETLGEYDAYLLKCEIEDLQDELQRRLDKRKARLST